MLSHPWARVHAVLSEVLDHTGPGRAALLDRLCGDDAGLRAEVELLLAHDARAGAEGFLAEAPFRLSEALPALDPFPDLAGRKIGPYEVVRRVARGGMGAVYLARRVDDYCQEVALKVVRPELGTDEMRRRF